MKQVISIAADKLAVPAPARRRGRAAARHAGVPGGRHVRRHAPLAARLRRAAHGLAAFYSALEVYRC